jgi:hypothetical protein
MKKILAILAAVMVLSAAGRTVAAQTAHRGSDDMKIGVAGYTYRSFDLDQTLRYL